MRKLYSSKAFLKMASREMHPPDLPLPAPITSLTTTLTSRFGFSMMWDQFSHSCFEITARTALTQFRHFTFKTRVWFQKGDSPPWCATDPDSVRNKKSLWKRYVFSATETKYRLSVIDILCRSVSGRKREWGTENSGRTTKIVWIKPTND